MQVAPRENRFFVRRKIITLMLAIAFVTVVGADAIAQSSGTQTASTQPPGNQRTGPPPSQPQQPPPAPSGFGRPLDGLTGAEIAAFNDGRDEFLDVATKHDGLGPIFNRDSCAACHNVPALGGGSNINVTRFGHSTGSSFDPLSSLGGSLLQELAIDPMARETVPSQANVTAHRQSTALFGLGLIEAIPDATILNGVRTKAVSGVLGKASMVADVATGKVLVGRFGWKAQHATVLSFSGDAYLNEMGITNRLFPTENAPNGNAALLKKFDTVKDPEDVVDPVTGKADIDKLADFMRFLAPPPPGQMNASTTFGGKIFGDVGCVLCHTPMMRTGSSKTAALSSKNVMLFSDLLLHDMGTLGDGIGQGSAGVREMKTPPLWGVGATAPYLHDGRARDLDEAIRLHDGEAKSIRDNYMKLTTEQKNLLIQFLKSI